MSSRYDFGDADVFWSGVAAGVLVVSPEARARVEALLGGKFPQASVEPTTAAKPAPFQGVDARVVGFLVRHSEKWTAEERDELAQELLAMTDEAKERSARVPDGSEAPGVTQMWLRDFAQEHGFAAWVPIALWSKLDTDDDVKELAVAGGVDLTLGSRNDFQLNQLRAFYGLPGLTELDGFASDGQLYKLLQALEAYGLKAPKPKRVETNDDVTLENIGAVATIVAEALGLQDPSEAANKLFDLLGSSGAKKLVADAEEEGVELVLGPDGGYSLRAVTLLSKQPGLTKLRYFSAKSQSYRLLHEVVRLSYA